jgi:hypothetical protein
MLMQSTSLRAPAAAGGRPFARPLNVAPFRRDVAPTGMPRRVVEGQAKKKGGKGGGRRTHVSGAAAMQQFLGAPWGALLCCMGSGLHCVDSCCICSLTLMSSHWLPPSNKHVPAGVCEVTAGKWLCHALDVMNTRTGTLELQTPCKAKHPRGPWDHLGMGIAQEGHPSFVDLSSQRT